MGSGDRPPRVLHKPLGGFEKGLLRMFLSGQELGLDIPEHHRRYGERRIL